MIGQRSGVHVLLVRCVDIDINTGLAFGPNAETFNNYLRVLSRERLSILINSWDDVSKDDQNMLFNIH